MFCSDTSSAQNGVQNPSKDLGASETLTTSASNAPSQSSAKQKSSDGGGDDDNVDPELAKYVAFKYASFQNKEDTLHKNFLFATTDKGIVYEL